MKLRTATMGLLAAAMTALAPAMAGVGLPAANASGVGVDIGIDPVAIGNSINDAVKTSKDRQAFLENAVNTVYFNFCQNNTKCSGVLIMNLQQAHDDTKLRVGAYQPVVFDGIDYGLYVASGGDFTNKGDGGYINWFIRGRFTRHDNGNDKTISFQNVA